MLEMCDLAHYKVPIRQNDEICSLLDLVSGSYQVNDYATYETYFLKGVD